MTFIIPIWPKIKIKKKKRKCLTFPGVCVYSGDGVSAALCSDHRAQSALLDQHEQPDVRLHQRRGTRHGGELPGLYRNYPSCS